MKKQHKIIDRPWEYRIIEISFVIAPKVGEPFLDLTLQNEKVIRKLRFHAPKDIKIEEGFPAPTCGMEIIDVSDRQLEGISVQVSDFEASHGAITFLARDVIEV